MRWKRSYSNPIPSGAKLKDAVEVTPSSRYGIPRQARNDERNWAHELLDSQLPLSSSAL